MFIFYIKTHRDQRLRSDVTVMVRATGKRRIPIRSTRLGLGPGVLPVTLVPGRGVEGLVRGLRGDVREEWLLGGDGTLNEGDRDVPNDGRCVVASGVGEAEVAGGDAAGDAVAAVRVTNQVSFTILIYQSRGMYINRKSHLYHSRPEVEKAGAM